VIRHHTEKGSLIESEVRGDGILKTRRDHTSGHLESLSGPASLPEENFQNKTPNLHWQRALIPEVSFKWANFETEQFRGLAESQSRELSVSQPQCLHGNLPPEANL
jgi:hypothetical protein